MESHNEKTVLAYWVYTCEEWKTFMRKENRRKGFFHWIFHWLCFGSTGKIPEVEITSEKISVGNRHHPFNTDNNTLRRVNILDEGMMNVMEICYDSGTKNFETFIEIRVPVPRGKLKEAILVQEKLFNKSG